MKVIVDKTIPDLSDEEIEEIKDGSLPSVEEDMEGFKEAMSGVDTVVLSPQIERELEAMGMTKDELIAMIMEKAGKLS